MKKFENEIYNSVVHNASLFLKDGVSKLFEGDNFNRSDIDHDTFVLAVSNIQMAMELAAKAIVLYQRGLRSILSNDQKDLSIEELKKLYQAKKLKVKEFQNLKKQMSSDEVGLNLTSCQLRKIEEFQQYRNRLFHLTCNISDQELSNMRDNLLLYSIQIVMYLLFDRYENKRPTEFLAQLTHWDYFHTLQHSKVYREAMKEIAKRTGNTIVICPFCDELAYSVEEEFCHVCCFYGYDLSRTDCEECNGKQMVVYHKGARFDGHPNVYSGFCQCCETKNAIFECPVCGSTHHYYFENEKPHCTEDHCINS